MKCAIYARKSNDDNGKAVEDKSVERQVAHCRNYIAQKGWVLAGEEHIYIDDGISGAEFKNRPALLQMLNNLKEFDAIVLSEQSRLGREMSQMGGVIARIVSRGIRVFFYSTDSELRYESAVDKFLVTAVAFANEMERELASQRARDAALKRAREGRNFGGRAYGYDNIWRLLDGTEQVARPNKSKPTGAQTVYRVNPVEAKIIRSIFRMYGDGHGAKAIAYTLNGAPSHAQNLKRYFGGARVIPPRGGSASWSPNTIHDILRNPRYRGFVPYGATKKALDLAQGTKRRIRGEEQLFPMPELRIVDDDLANAVRQRVERMRSVYQRAPNGALRGRPDKGLASRYLLSGLVRCEECGSSMIVSSYLSGTRNGRRHIRCYVCNFRSNRGPTACSNRLRPRLDQLDAEVVAAIEQKILTTPVIRAAARRAAELIRERTATKPETVKARREEIATLETQRARLVAAIRFDGKALEPLVEALKETERQIKLAQNDLETLEQSEQLSQTGQSQLEQQLMARARHFKELISRNTPLARQAIRSLMSGPIWLTPQKDGGYRLRGTTPLGALWPESDAEKTSVKMASPRPPELIPTFPRVWADLKAA